MTKEKELKTVLDYDIGRHENMKATIMLLILVSCVCFQTFAS